MNCRALQARIVRLEAIYGPTAGSSPINHLRVPPGDQQMSTPKPLADIAEQTSNVAIGAAFDGTAEHSIRPTVIQNSQFQPSSFSSDHQGHIVKNPEKKVPRFNGDPIKFDEWWSLFSYYVDSKPIDPTEKCPILKNSLVGRALQTVAHLRIAAESYEIMKYTIQESFGDPDAARAALLQNIHVVCRAKDLSKPSKFISFALTLAQNVRSLEALGEGFERLSSLSPMILSCLTHEMKLEFNQKWEERDSDSVSKVEYLLSFLEWKKRLFDLGEPDVGETGFPEEIDLLLANDCLHQVYAGQYKRFGKVLASPTIFGWVFWGQSGSNAVSQLKFTTSGVVICSSISSGVHGQRERAQRSIEEIENLEFLWDSEFLGVEHSTAGDADESARAMIERFKNSVKRLPSGQYSVSLPLKDNLHTLGDNQKLAYSRLIAFLKNAKKDPEFLKAVDREIQKYLNSGFIELAEPRSPGELAHYIPILAVAKKSATNDQERRVRVVKDCGSRSRDEASLNDVLETGPSLLPDILIPLLQFRSFPIVIIAYIKQAFMNFLIEKEHRTFLRFFWPTKISENPNAAIREYWARVLDFGISSSPFLHCMGLRHHLDSEAERLPDKAQLLEQLKSSFFMDDLCTGASSVDEAKVVVRTIQQLADSVVKTVGPDREVSASDESSKFLGTHWNQRGDSLFIDVANIIAFFESEPLTKRQLIRGLAKIYDPLGLICPIAINFKFLMQIIWSRRIDWDVELPDDLRAKYLEAVNNLKNAPFIQVERNLFELPRDQATRELHVFADASFSAFGTSAYIREFQGPYPKDKVSVKFIMAKTRVTPLKGKWTIPRLELMAALLAARMASKIRKYLSNEIDSIHMYSDSSSVLGWIRDTPDRWTQFVSNRIREIQSLTDPNSWSYIRSEENPSDLLSRASPLDSEELRKLWLQGPPWLGTSGSPEPHLLNAIPPRESLPERRAELVVTSSTRPTPIGPLFSKQFGSWQKAVRVLAYARRFALKKEKPSDLVVEAIEFRNAEEALIKYIQRCCFSAELASNCGNITRSSKLYQFNPFVSEDGYIRCRSRLQHSSKMNFDEKCPILLMGEDFLVRLLLRSIHEFSCLHSGGVASILQEVRKKFFVIRARRAAKAAIAGCKGCARYRAVKASEPIPPLPTFRLEASTPFECSGTDHAGPIYFKSDTGVKTKGYILLFVCATTRACRLEMVPDLSTNEFLLALRRFIARNPTVQRIVSDNSKTFHKASRELNAIFQNARTPKTRDFLAAKRIEWEYSTPLSPWQGGFFERVVQMVKRPLRKIMGVHTLKYRELEATLFEIERMINNRPLTAVIIDPDEPRALSPSDLLYGYSAGQPLPETKRILQEATSASAAVFSRRWLS
ncbi:uncharacterized protein LOC100904124 [Galendromus occidentalis]|uniref:Uncharacterized protein LOC100904124 n=1 Tax=Galendromus occidentalis TaxID=34638 RepID=A0AAJ6VW53_9ACAR|nr:uncharacterized protein LOC100904124 [Galendromus occidentalis]